MAQYKTIAESNNFIVLDDPTRIVSILDAFDTLTASISEGLPKEIALRKQQYAYYRDFLLTFNT